MALVIVEALFLFLLAVFVLVFILFVAVTLFIAHVHRKYAHLPGPPYDRCSKRCSSLTMLSATVR